MAPQALSVGDILMLSQTAWKIARAFRQGSQGCPSDFANAEREASSLSEALKLSAETLQSDARIPSFANQETKSAVDTIFQAASTTLSDVEGFVDRYQVIKKRENKGGFGVERSWSGSVLANHNNFEWTSQGGDIFILCALLRMHASTINMTIKALQSQTPQILEQVVLPIAGTLTCIHRQEGSDLSDRINDVNDVVASLASISSPLHTHDAADATHKSGPAVATFTIGSTPTSPTPSTSSQVHDTLPPRSSSFLQSRQRSGASLYKSGQTSRTQSVVSPSMTASLSRQQTRDDSAYWSGELTASERDVEKMDWDFETGQPPGESSNAGNYTWHATSQEDESTTRPLQRGKDAVRRESTTLPNLTASMSISPRDLSQSRSRHSLTRLPTIETASPQRSARSQSMLPPPALSPTISSQDSTPATPRTLLSSIGRLQSGRELTSQVSTQQSSKPVSSSSAVPRSAPQIKESPKPTVVSESSFFEKQLFRNSAILCDVRGKLVEYAHFISDEPDPRFNTEMRSICEEARICVIRRRENRELGGTRITTSIWVLTDDGKKRMQHKLSDIHETVPYCSYFQPEKVSLQPTEGDIYLRLHPPVWGEHVLEEKKTTWVNYIFESENDATAFQSAVYGRMLIGTYHTSKTTVIHEGFKGAFAMEEQFANIEMLRLWEDDGVSTPGAAGGILAMMHISSSFGEGWARWWVNNVHQQIRVKEDSSSRHAKIKGIDMTVVKPGMGAVADRSRITQASTPGSPHPDSSGASIIGIAKNPGKRMPVKRVNGIRIEFKTEEERNAFVMTCKRCQNRMLPLPDL